MGKDDDLDFKSWKIKQLQEYIKDNGGDDEDCDEKQDLIDRAIELRDKKREKEKEKKKEKEKPALPTDRNYPAPSYGGAPSAPPFNPQYGAPAPYNGAPSPYGGAPPPYGGAPPPYGGPPPPQYGGEYWTDYGAPPPYGGPLPYGGPPQGPYGGPPQGQWGGPPPQGEYGAYGQGPPGPYGGPPQGGYGGPPPLQDGYGAPPPQQPGYGEPPAQQGRKRALICACNYAGTDNALNGCINDAKCMQYLLKTRFGFKEEDITMLTDDQNDPAKWPTGNNMRAHMRRLVGDAQTGDSLIFHFSGHGSQTADWSGDEDDGYNETLCPCDFKQGGQIVDDELNQLLVNPLRPGVRLHAIIDACHSGSVLDMEYRAEFHNGMPVWTNEFSKRPSIYKGTAGGEAFQFGAARDSQTAADTSQLSGNVSTGAATFAFIQAIERVGTHISYGRLLDEMNRTLGDMGHGGGAGSGQPLSDPFQMGGLLGSLLGQGLGMVGGGQQYSNQTPVLSSNSAFDINRQLSI